MSWSSCCKDGATPECFLGICYRRLLDTQWEGRGTRRIKKQQSETAWRGKERFQGVGSEYSLCNKTKQRGFDDEARKRIRHSHAQCKNNQTVFRIVSRLNRVIPVVEHLNKRTNKTRQQNNRDHYSRHPRPHGHEYIPTADLRRDTQVFSGSAMIRWACARHNE